MLPPLVHSRWETAKGSGKGTGKTPIHSSGFPGANACFYLDDQQAGFISVRLPEMHSELTVGLPLKQTHAVLTTWNQSGSLCDLLDVSAVTHTFSTKAAREPSGKAVPRLHPANVLGEVSRRQSSVPLPGNHSRLE